MSLLNHQLDAKAIASQLDEEGLVCIENVVDPAWIGLAQDYVSRLVEQKGRRYFSLNWPARELGSPPAGLTDDPAMRQLMASLARIGCPKAALDAEIYAGLRVVAGSTGDEKSLIHHYDKYVITAVVPILIPPGPKRLAGEFIIFPNRRGYRRFALFNIIEKAIVQSGWYQRRFTSRLPEGDIPEIKLLKPGNLYLFWGYRSYHSNFPADADLVRATLILHYGDPHPASLILRAKKFLQVRDERRNLARSPV